MKILRRAFMAFVVTMLAGLLLAACESKPGFNSLDITGIEGSEPIFACSTIPANHARSRIFAARPW